MATRGIISATITDIVKRQNPDGSMATLVEILKQDNEILQDMTLVACNNGISHRTTVRATLPEVEFRLFNQGVKKSKSTTFQVEDGTAMAEAYADVDKDLAAINGNTQEFRLSEDRAFIEAMNQEQARTLFYGNVALEPKKYTGFAPRFGKLTYDNVLDFGGQGDTNTSVWLIPWGDNTVHGIYPKATVAGLQVSDLGEQTVTDANGGMFQALRTHYQWKLGLCVRDSRYVKRIANIDMANISSVVEQGSVSQSEGQKLIRLMIAAVNRLPSASSCSPIWYMNKDVKTMLDIMAMEKANVHLSIGEFEGSSVTRFLGFPIRQLDALVNTEERVQ